MVASQQGEYVARLLNSHARSPAAAANTPAAATVGNGWRSAKAVYGGRVGG
jgi:hypothetical protein